MQEKGYAIDLMFRRYLTRTTRSGKTFRRDLNLGAKYNALLGASDSDEEESILKTPQGAPQIVNQGQEYHIHPLHLHLHLHY